MFQPQNLFYQMPPREHPQITDKRLEAGGFTLFLNFIGVYAVLKNIWFTYTTGLEFTPGKARFLPTILCWPLELYLSTAYNNNQIDKYLKCISEGGYEHPSRYVFQSFLECPTRWDSFMYAWLPQVGRNNLRVVHETDDEGATASELPQGGESGHQQGRTCPGKQTTIVQTKACGCDF